MELKDVESFCQLAGLEVLSTHKLWNQYYTNPTTEFQIQYCLEHPWWLVETPYGLIVMGWRKRVIELNWERTKLRKKITEDDVTNELTYVHACSDVKFLEYLKNLAFELLALEAGI